MRTAPSTHRPTIVFAALSAATVTFALAGCGPLQPATPAQLKQGLVWMFPGVEGGPITLSPAYAALRKAGVAAGIRVHDWNRPFGLLANLMSYDGNRRDAVSVANDIVAYSDRYPGRPVDLVGYSGGGGMAVMVLEALPDDVQVRNVVLCQPALSPTYNLTRALRRVSGKLVNHFSPLDLLVLGWGTKTFGTMDRKYEASAGLRGFADPINVDDPALADRVIQRQWTRELITTGHTGDHLGILLYAWNERCVAPYLVSRDYGTPMTPVSPEPNAPELNAPKPNAD